MQSNFCFVIQPINKKNVIVFSVRMFIFKQIEFQNAFRHNLTDISMPVISNYVIFLNIMIACVKII